MTTNQSIDLHGYSVLHDNTLYRRAPCETSGGESWDQVVELHRLTLPKHGEVLDRASEVAGQLLRGEETRAANEGLADVLRSFDESDLARWAEPGPMLRPYAVGLYPHRTDSALTVDQSTERVDAIQITATYVEPEHLRQVLSKTHPAANLSGVLADMVYDAPRVVDCYDMVIRNWDKPGVYSMLQAEQRNRRTFPMGGTRWDSLGQTAQAVSSAIDQETYRALSDVASDSYLGSAAERLARNVRDHTLGSSGFDKSVAWSLRTDLDS